MEQMKEKNTQVFLVLSDKSKDAVMLYEQILQMGQGYGDIFLLYHQKTNLLPEEVQKRDHFIFTDTIITQSNYFPVGFSLVPGNVHYPVLQFFLQNPNYDYYWCIEDDVRFSGDWTELFRAFDTIGSDFITSHIRTSSEEPAWYWWHALANPYQVIDFKDRIKSFNPIFRISQAALAFIHDALISGWCGHNEVLFPTLLFEAGFDITDFGGNGPFVRPGFENKFYLEQEPNNPQTGTMRWRPVFDQTGKEKNKLYHPVKEKKFMIGPEISEKKA